MPMHRTCWSRRRAAERQVRAACMRDPQEGRSRHLWLEIPAEARVRHILEDYRPQEHGPEIMEAYLRIKSRIHTPIAAESKAA